MNNNITTAKSVNLATNSLNILGFYSSILITIVTAITFGISIFTPPISGPFCAEPSIKYPYTDIISRFPRDYFWMYPAILLTIIFVALMVCIYNYASKDKKIYGQLGLSFAITSATILLINYFIQISVIQPSILNKELDSIAIFTQYNPHGIFIALEEIAYLIMGISFICIVPIFERTNKLEIKIRWVLVISFILTVISLIAISIFYGINREYRFEVAAITIDWLTLIILGILLSILFRNSIKQ